MQYRAKFERRVGVVLQKLAMCASYPPPCRSCCCGPLLRVLTCALRSHERGRRLVVATWCQRDNSTMSFTPEEEKKLDFLYSEWTHPHFISINVRVLRCSVARPLPGVSRGKRLTDILQVQRGAVSDCCCAECESLGLWRVRVTGWSLWVLSGTRFPRCRRCALLAKYALSAGEASIPANFCGRAGT